MNADDRDARLLAALAFFSLVIPGWGGFLSLIIYLAARRTLPYARFHAAQATVVHAATVTGLLIAGAVLGIATMLKGPESVPQVRAVAVGLLVGAVALCVGLGLLGAVMAWRSGFRVPGIANLIDAD